MDLLKQKRAPVREKRLSAIGAYYGDIKTILQEYTDGKVNQRIRTFSQDTYNDVQYALRLINSFRDTAIVVHGPAGCATARLYLDLAYDDSVKWAVTNLNERDSIMGSEVKLREAILEVFHYYSPQIVFVVTTPVVAINNDDVESIVCELREELEIGIVPIYTDAFRSRTGISGYDEVLHALGKNFWATKEPVTGNYLNLLSLSESKEDQEELQRLLGELGLEVNVFPKFNGPGELNKATGARFSVSVNPDEANYAGTLLQDNFDIPYIQPSIPIGLRRTSLWLTAVGQKMDRQEDVRQIIERESSGIIHFLSGNQFQGQKIFIHLPPSLAFAFGELAENLGLSVAGIKVPYLDVQHKEDLEKLNEKYPEIPIIVGEGQIFEEASILSQIKPDIYVSKEADPIAAIRAGIPVLNVQSISILGYQGIYQLAEQLKKKLANPSFSRYLSGNNSQVYTSNWEKKKGNWFIKQEVK